MFLWGRVNDDRSQDELRHASGLQDSQDFAARMDSG